jgi:hypothetical protein
VVANLEAAMNAEFKKSVSPDEFVGKIVGMVEKIAGVSLAVTIGD